MTINLLDLNNDILEIICGKVKQDHLKRRIVKEEQVFKGENKVW